MAGSIKDFRYEQQMKDVRKMVDWKNPPAVQELQQDYDLAKAEHSNHVANVDGWLEDLKAKRKINIKEGRSKIQPKTVRKYSEWRIPSLEDPYLSAKDLFDVVPASANDIEAARQNKLILNKQFRIDIPRNRFINKYIRKACYTGSVIVKLGWEVKTGIVREEYDAEDTAQTQEEATIFLQQLVQSQQIAPEEAQQILESGQPIVIGTHKEIREVEKEIINRPVLEVKDSRDIIIDPTCEGDIRKARFIIDRFTTDLATLKSDGRYHNLDKINVDNSEPSSDPNISNHDVIFKFQDKPRQKIVVYEYWGDWDIDDNGMVKPIVAAYVGDTIIRLEENPFPFKHAPFVIVPYLPDIDDGIYGEPDAALLKEHQDIIGAITRGYVDILGRSANGQQAIAKGALDPINMDRFNNGENYQYNPNNNMDPRSLFFMQTFPEIPLSALNIIQLQHNEAEALTGIKAFNTGVTGNALGNNVGGINRALDATAKRETSILNRLSDGLVEIGRMIIAMNSVWLSDEEVIKISEDDFISIKRDDLAGDFDLIVSVSTADTDNMKAQELAYMLQTMGNSVDFEISKLLLGEIATLRKMPHLAKDIKNYTPKPDPLAQEKAMLEIELLKANIADIQARIAENSVDVELKSAKAQTELAKAQQLGAKARNTDSDSDKKDLEYIEQVTGLTQDRKVEELQVKNVAKIPIKG